MPTHWPYRNPDLPVAERVSDLLNRMTAEEKLGQLVLADGRTEAAKQVAECRVGAFLHVLGQRTLELQRLAECTGHGIPLLFGIDAIHGHGFWPGATVFPTQLTLSCSWNPELVERMCQITAKEMLCTGLQWTFSPVLCLTRDLRWGRVGETFGEDPLLVGVLGAAAVRGYQGSQLSDPAAVLACAKHYVGYCETVGGRDASEAELSRRKLLSYFLPPFEQAVRAGCKSVMTAYQCIDGVACVVNHWLLTELLRNSWGFSGVVVTDWDNVGRAHHEQRLYPSVDDVVPHAVRAGNDLIMVTPGFYDAALSRLQSGDLSLADIEQACGRVLSIKFEFGLFEHKGHAALDSVPEVVGCQQHRQALLPAALESIVLLKNAGRDGRPVLPLEANVRRIALLGPNADDPLTQLGDWSLGAGQLGIRSGGHPRHLVCTVLDGMRERAQVARVEVDYARGCDVLGNDAADTAEAASLAAQADVAVVVVGDVLEQVGEECDRADLSLTGGQLALLEAVRATGTALVVVLINSKPLCIPWVVSHADAILEAFNPGMEGGRAIARILFGDANPSGKLTVSFPQEVGQLPVYYNQLPGWHGSKYGHYPAEPLFSFGFGLSYTQYRYEKLRLLETLVDATTPVIALVDITNVGERAGVEIAQCYLNDLYSSLSTPVKVLCAFQRVFLEPGQCKTVRFELPTKALSFVGADGQPTIEPGDFEVMVGPSSRDVDLLRARFTLR